MKEVLSGFELEKWVEKFAQQERIATRSLPSAASTLQAAAQYLPKRLENALLFIDQDIPDGRELAQSLLQRPELIIPAVEDQQLAKYILDKAIATDLLLQVPNQNGRYVRMAVDVTSNPKEQKIKLDRIQGFPDPKDKLGTNRNLNFSKAREALGIEKHCVLVLNPQSEMLPSYEKMMNTIKAFANEPGETTLSNLTAVLESERYYAQPRHLQDPQRLFRIYLANTTQKQPGQQFIEIVTQALQDQHPRETIEAILLQHPFFDGYRNPRLWPKAQQMANNVYKKQAAAQQETSQLIEPRQEKEITLNSWPEIASALGKPQQYQAWVREELRGELSTVGDRAFKQDVGEFQQKLQQLGNWLSAAQKLKRSPEHLQQIRDSTTAFRKGAPLSADNKAMMDKDLNQLRYQQLAKSLPEGQQALPQLAQKAAALGYSPQQITRILSFDPRIQAIQKRQGDRASQTALKQAVIEGVKQDQSQQPKSTQEKRSRSRGR